MPRMENSLHIPGDDHIVCYGGDPGAAQVTWHSTSQQLVTCGGNSPTLCLSCGGICQGNGGIGQDPPLNGSTSIFIYTNSSGYRNQDLQCRAGGQSAFMGVYLVDGGG